jgi:tetratricopeptide (TPR) repeat protein
MQRDLLGEQHPDVAFALTGLAFVQYDRGETQVAFGTLRESLAIYRHLFPGDHPEVARTLNRIGFWRTLAADYAGARRDLTEALEMRRRLYGDSHPEIASSLTHVAILQVATGDFAGALESAGTARKIYGTTYSPEHWRALLPASAEGAAYTGLGRYPEAEKLLLHSSDVLNKDPEVLPAYRTLARQYLDALKKRMNRAGG